MRISEHRVAGDRDDVSDASSMDIEREEGEVVSAGNFLIPKPPKFAGKRSELPYFLERMKKYFKYNLGEEAEDSYKVDILSCYLEGSAAEWFANLEKMESPLLNSYDGLIEAMKERYKTCASADVANSRLAKVKSSQFRSVMEYCDHFEKIARDSSFNDEAKIHFFVEGLPTSVRERTKMFYPRIRKLPELINTVAANVEEDRRVYGHDPMEVDGRRLRSFSRNLGRYTQNFRNYEDEEATEKKTKVKKCFICKSTGHVKKDCPKFKEKLANRSKAFILKSDSKRMLNVFDIILKTDSGLKVKALVDSGSDLDFVDWEAAKRMRIPIQRLQKDKYVEGLGGNGTLGYQTTPLIMIIGDHEVSIQFYVTILPTNIPIILGSQWLKKHDPKIGFKDQTIEFPSEYCKKNCCATRCQIEEQIKKNEEKKKEEKKKREETAQEIIDNYKSCLVKLNNRNKEKKDKHVISIVNKDKCIKKKTCEKILKNNKVLSKKYTICCVIKEKENDKVLEEVPVEYEEYKSVFDEIECNELPPHRIYDCKIKLKDKDNLFYGPLYPLTEEERTALKEYIKENLEKGFIRPSNSPAGAPVLFVKKKDNTLRLCVDYRRLNENTIRDSYPLPLITELFDRLREARIFTKLDLKSAYNLVRINPGDEYKTAFRTRYGHFEYLVMPFGLKNAPATFQHFINDVLGEYLDDFAFSYIDDILIYSKNLEEHRVHVKKVLERLKKNGLYVKLSKCEFETNETTFLGHIISDKGIAMDPAKVKAIKEWPIPTNVTEVQSFIGLCNYYRRFIPSFANIAKPLHNLTKKGVNFDWSTEYNNAFEVLKDAFTKEPILVHANPDLEFIVETDASNFAIGAVLSQRQPVTNELHPICYYSRGLTKSEKNYPIYDKELLAVISACKEWRHYLEGAKHPFKVFTDHKNLTFPRKPELLSQRQIRWNLFLTRFDFSINYRPGKEGGKPDAFSRRADYSKHDNDMHDEEEHIASCLTVQEIRDNVSIVAVQGSLREDLIKESKNDEEILNIIKMLKGEIAADKRKKKLLKEFHYDESNEGLLFYRKLIYVPVKLRNKIISIHHDSLTAGHFGYLKNRELISRNFIWLNMVSDIINYISTCSVCCSAKDERHKPYGLLVPLPTPKKPWSSISLDFITDLPKSKNKTVVMVIVDRFSKMAHFIPFRMLPTAQIAADVFLQEIFRLHGLPDEIISDRGTQFTAEFWQRLCSLLCIDHKLSSAHHPQTDGQTERVNGILEQYLRCYSNEKQDNWVCLLPYAEFAYNNTLQQSIKQTPFYANYGYHPRSSPLVAAINGNGAAHDRAKEIQKNFLFLRSKLEEAKLRYKKYADMGRIPGPEFKVNDLVWLKRNDLINKGSPKLNKRKVGPFKIVKKINTVTYQLELPKKYRCHPVFHISEMEPYRERSSNIESTVNLKIPELSVDTECHDKYEPMEILKDAIVKGVKFYCVLFKGSDNEEWRWCKEEEIEDPQLIQEYLSAKKGKRKILC